MLKHLVLATSLATGALAAVPAAAQGSGVCRGLSGNERTACLRAELDRGQRHTNRLDAFNRGVDTTRDVVCAGRFVGSAVAGAAGKIKGGTVGGLAGKGVFHAGAAVGDAALNNPHPCTPRAR